MKYLYLSLFCLSLFSCGEIESKNNDHEQANKEQDSTQNDSKVKNTMEDQEVTNGLESAHNRTVVFYNVENLFDTKDDPFTSDDDFTPHGYKEWDDKRYSKKINDLSEVFSSISDDLPALVGLAEIENEDVLQDLISNSKMKEANYKIIHDESPDTRGIDVALLVDTDVFNYDHHESIRIDFPWDSNIKTRDILHVVGHFKGEDKVHIFVNHWPSRRDGVAQTEPKRLEVAGKLRDKLNDIYLDEIDPKIIIMGDFNDAPDNKSVEYVLNCMNTNSVEKGQHDLKDGQLMNLSYPHLLSIDFKHNDLGTLVHDNQWEILDQMMCSQSLLTSTSGTKINSASSIFNPDWILYKRNDGSSSPNKTYGGKRYYGGYSDHLPVYLILKDAE